MEATRMVAAMKNSGIAPIKVYLGECLDWRSVEIIGVSVLRILENFLLIQINSKEGRS
jgi:hypothetical protein